MSINQIKLLFPSFLKSTSNHYNSLSIELPFTEQIPSPNENDSETEVPFQLTSPQITIPALHPYGSSFAQERTEKEYNTEFDIDDQEASILLLIIY